jgi:protocatechuate 3,4-dioxygenase beta subunit
MATTQNQTDEQAKADGDVDIDALVAAKVAEALANHTPANVTIEAVAGSVSEPETTASDTTIPGGRYIVNGKVVDANGNPLKGEKAEDGA